MLTIPQIQQFVADGFVALRGVLLADVIRESIQEPFALRDNASEADVCPVEAAILRGVRGNTGPNLLGV
jgi:hypothetical protein